MKTPSTESKNISAAWQKRADWLARWTMTQLVNRQDIWARYLPLEKRSPGSDGKPIISRLAPASRKKRGVLQLSERALIRHYRGEDPGHLIGIQSANGSNHSRWMAVDLDNHSNGITPLDNLRAATHWRDELISHGFHPLLMDTDGAGGYCLLVIFREAVPTAKVHAFAETLVRDHADVGLAQRPKILPNAAVADPENWLRLPGRDPLADHWTRVWNGHHWQDGADAVEALLHAHGDLPTLIRKFVPSAGSGFYNAHATTTSHTAHGSKPDSNNGHARQQTRCEAQILAYLLAATRTGDEAAAFGIASSSQITADSFHLPAHKNIYAALERLFGQGERITPTDIAEEIPPEHRPLALAAIDELILEKPVDADTFEANVQAVTSAPHAAVDEAPDGTLEAVTHGWARLSPEIRRAIAALVEAAGR